MLKRNAAQHHQLFETASFYDINQLRDDELLLLILDRLPTKTRLMALKSVKTMIDERGGLDSLLHTEIAELSATLEVDEQTATRLKAIVELARRLHKPHEKRYQITSADDIARLMQPEMMHLDHEELHVLVLDTRNQVVHWDKTYRGTVNSSILRVAEILRPAIVRNCPRIILVHNHPSNDETPSFEDIEETKMVVQAGSLLDIDVLDHIIIGNPRYTSLKEKLRW